jgi:hypothetical protein
LKVIFLEAARHDLKEAVRFYEAEQPGLGAEFREEVRAAVERIKKLPEGWQILSEKTGGAERGVSHMALFIRPRVTKL